MFGNTTFQHTVNSLFCKYSSNLLKLKISKEFNYIPFQSARYVIVIHDNGRNICFIKTNTYNDQTFMTEKVLFVFNVRYSCLAVGITCDNILRILSKIFISRIEKKNLDYFLCLLQALKQILIRKSICFFIFSYQFHWQSVQFEIDSFDVFFPMND